MRATKGFAVAIVALVVSVSAVWVLTRTSPGDVTDGLPTVVISNRDIPADTPLGPLIEKGYFSEIRVPYDALVEGAVTVIDDLADETTSAPILAHEQIPAARLVSSVRRVDPMDTARHLAYVWHLNPGEEKALRKLLRDLAPPPGISA